MPCRREPRFPSPRLSLLLLWYRLHTMMGTGSAWMDGRLRSGAMLWLAGTRSVTEVSSQSRSFRIRQVTNTPTGWRLSRSGRRAARPWDGNASTGRFPKRHSVSSRPGLMMNTDLRLWPHACLTRVPGRVSPPFLRCTLGCSALPAGQITRIGAAAGTSSHPSSNRPCIRLPTASCLTRQTGRLPGSLAPSQSPHQPHES